MADAVKSDEIEDVLSSIRRLVSEHQPPARSEAAVVQNPAMSTDETAPVVDDRSPPADRLLLTPALRVTDPEDPWVPITPRAEEDASAATGDPQEPEIARDDGADWARDLWAEDELAEGGLDAEDLIDHAPDPQLQADQWEAGDAALPQDAVVIEEDGLSDPVDVTEAVLQGVAQDLASPVTDGEDDIADVPLSFIRSTKSVGEYEPEEENDALVGGDLPAPMLELAEARAAHAETHTEDAPRVKVKIVRAASPHDEVPVEDEVAAAADAAHSDGPAAAEEMPAQDASVEPADAPIADASPEPGAEDTLTDFLAPVSDEPPAQDALDVRSDTVEDLGEAPFIFPDDNEGFVDEEALRDIIAEVVREELQGDMGVRITRNVRKLVRREIRLALAAQDIE